MERVFFFPSSGPVLAGGTDWLIEVRKEVLALGGTGLEDVVPIVLGGTEAAKRGAQSDHLRSHSVTCGVRIETAIDGKALG